MACNECNNYINPCTQCNDSCEGSDSTCNCAVKDLSTDCSVYTGDDLSCSGISKDTVLTKVIQDLDAHICNKFEEAIQYLTLVNIGTGAEVFKGINGVGNKELRTIISGDLTLIDVVENTDTVDITPGTPSLNLDSGTDILSLIVTTLAGSTVFDTVDLSEYNYDTFVQSASFDSGTLDLTIVRNNGELDIVIPLDFLNNHVESGTYAAGTITFTLTDSSTVDIDLSTLVSELTQVQSDVLETNSSSKAFIQNKNPNKTVVLGAAGNYNVLDADNNYVIEIDNSANDVTIDFSTITATDNYFVGFVQKGTGLVTFNNADIVPQDFLNELYGQGHVAAIEVINSTKYLAGTLKAS
mgnify:CR=1 FL=1